ncbi:GAF domain-containing protein [Campylobacterota bacterium DY0563]
MKHFIKATEIWELNSNKTELVLSKGIYENFKEFEEESNNLTFKYNEGLPGRAWAQKHPIVLTKFEGSYFKRAKLANKINITAAIAMPIFAGEYLHSVVVFLCGDNEEHSGAIELWQANKDRVKEMELVDGYYGTMEDFEWISRNIKIMKSQGLPGTVWETSMPLMMKNLGESATFMRASKATKAGITTALALPSWIEKEDGYVITFLSGKNTPIARRFEIWLPFNDELVFSDGYSIGDIDLFEVQKDVKYKKNDSSLGRVWSSGYPILCEKSDMQNAPGEYDAVLVLPLLEKGFFKGAVVFYY